LILLTSVLKVGDRLLIFLVVSLKGIVVRMDVIRNDILGFSLCCIDAALEDLFLHGNAGTIAYFDIEVQMEWFSCNGYQARLSYTFNQR
jgi:hypothetical protein